MYTYTYLCCQQLGSVHDHPMAHPIQGLHMPQKLLLDGPTADGPIG